MHQNKNQNQNQQHVPVLLREVLQYLDPKAEESYLDLTAGYGGHASEILARTGSLTHNSSVTTLVDRDENAMAILKQLYGATDIDLRQQDFLSASQQLVGEDRRYDMILADLGVSSPHLDEVGRGFSFTEVNPLDMRMDQRQALTASQVVNTFKEADLSDILRKYGEEPKAAQIAKAIVRARPIATANELAAIAKAAWPGYSRVHPATRTFQAIRIAVNDELGQLEQAMPLWLQLLKPGGRLAIISFHSLEDRLAKQFLSEHSGERYDAELRLLIKRPVTADLTETVTNPRARSAKLRAAVKK